MTGTMPVPTSTSLSAAMKQEKIRRFISPKRLTSLEETSRMGISLAAETALRTPTRF